MTEQELHERYLVELGFLEQVVRDRGMPTELLERSRDVPYHTLLVRLEPDSKARPRQLALNFYPVEKDMLENTMLLQYFIAFPFEATDEGRSRLLELLPDLNNRVVLGHFGLTAGQNQLHYRYVQALRSDDVVSEESVGDVLLLVGYTPVLFQDTLEEVAAGRRSLEEARSAIEAAYQSF